MAYTKLLNKVIDDSGLSLKEIAIKCKEYDVKITPSYLSALKNDTTNRSPSDDVSRAIAKACNVQKGYENILVIETYIDNAPLEMNKLFDLLRETWISSTASIFENKLTTQQSKEIKKYFSEFPMAEFIVSLSSDLMKEEIIKQSGAMKLNSKSTFDDMIIEQRVSPLGMPVSDNGMSPIVNKGDIVNTEVKEINEYKTGDVILVSKTSRKKILFARKIIIDKAKPKELTLMPINTDFMPETINISELMILGKITQVTKKI